MLEAGPLLGGIRVERRFGASVAVQTIRLTAGSPRLDLCVEIDWHESQRLFKLVLPIDVHSDRATAEIQFGHVHRPIHGNTSWDESRFESYAHR